MTTSAEPTHSDYEDLADPSRLRSHANRIIAAAIFTPCFAVLALAAWLEPSSEGMGTHTQLGLPACGFIQVTGYPCATCGCTTAFSHAANGSLLDAFLTQPFGATLALLTAMTVLITGYAAVTNMPLAPLGRIVFRARSVVALMILLVLSWGYLIYLHRGG